jgi:CNT family concentrative nucleoside transporter
LVAGRAVDDACRIGALPTGSVPSPGVETPLLLRLQSLLGLAVLLGLMWGIGRLLNRKSAPGAKVPWRIVGWGIGLQFLFAILILLTPPGRWVFEKLNRLVVALLDASEAGASLLFGSLARGNNAPVGPPLNPNNPAFAPVAPTESVAGIGAFFAFNVLPTIIFFSALLGILYHTGLMHRFVAGMAWVMRRTMKTSGAETLAASANVFVGQTEAPLFVRPYLPTMTRSELNAVMIGGFANIASGVLGVYAGMLNPLIEDAGAHLLAASVISAPAGLVVAKLLVPETAVPETADVSGDPHPSPDANLLDAAVRGTRDGLLLAANVGAVLIVFTGLVWLLNSGLGAACDGLNDLLGRIGIDGDPVPILTMEAILGWLLWPIAWLCGVPAEHCRELGSLIGIKTVLNEFLGYLRLEQGILADPDGYLSPRTRLIALYALCGFANFASVGIQIGGIGILAPNRRADLARLGLIAMLGGGVASLLTACVVGVLI